MIADRTAYDVRYTGKLSNRFRLGQATNGWYARSDLTLPSGWVQSTPALRPQYGPNAQKHDPIQRVEFMNAPKLHLLKRDHWAWQTKVQ